jgi:hypothetical protein
VCLSMYMYMSLCMQPILHLRITDMKGNANNMAVCGVTEDLVNF